MTRYKLKSEINLESIESRPMLSISNQVCSLDVLDEGSAVSYNKPKSRLH